MHFLYNKWRLKVAALVTALIGIVNLFYYAPIQSHPPQMEFTYPIVDFVGNSGHKILKRILGSIPLLFYPAFIVYHSFSYFKKRKISNTQIEG